MTISAMATDQTSSVVLELSDGRSAGCRMGDTTGDYIGFLGHAPVARQAKNSAVTGASDSTAVAAAITAISTALQNYGLIA